MNLVYQYFFSNKLSGCLVVRFIILEFVNIQNQQKFIGFAMMYLYN